MRYGHFDNEHREYVIESRSADILDKLSWGREFGCGCQSYSRRIFFL